MVKAALFGVVESAWEFETPSVLSDDAPRQHIGNAEDSDFVNPDLVPFLPFSIEAPRNHVMASVLTDVVLTGPTGTDVVKQLHTFHKFEDNRAVALSQHVAPHESPVVYRFAAGMTRRVELGDAGGLVVRGNWTNSHDTERGIDIVSWDPMRGAHVLWSEGNHVFVLLGEEFSDAELQEVARMVKRQDSES